MEEVNNIKNRLMQIKNTHPNIYNLWNTYIEKKLDSLKILIDECKNTIDVIENNDNISDLTDDNLVTIFFLMFCLNYETDMT
jgi:hypothetical protein